VLLGVGTLEIWYEHISLDPATGEGTFSGKFLITIPDKGTIAGNGSLIAKGSFDATFTSPIHFSMDCVGTSTYP